MLTAPTWLAASIRRVLNESFPKTLGEETRKTAVAVGIGRAIAYALDLPTSPVGDVRGYYLATYDRQACDIITAVNEQYLLEVELTRSVAMRYYEMRYALVFNPNALDEHFATLAPLLADFLPERALRVLQQEGDSIPGKAWSALLGEASLAIKRTQGE